MTWERLLSALWLSPPGQEAETQMVLHMELEALMVTGPVCKVCVILMSSILES